MKRWWRKRKALRVLNHAKFHLWKTWGEGVDYDAVHLITETIWVVMDETGGQP